MNRKRILVTVLIPVVASGSALLLLLPEIESSRRLGVVALMGMAGPLGFLAGGAFHGHLNGGRAQGAPERGRSLIGLGVIVGLVASILLPDQGLAIGITALGGLLSALAFFSPKLREHESSS